MEPYITREQNSILQTYKRLPIIIDKAFGCRIYDKDGNTYLDFLGGIAVNALGHSNPKIIHAVGAQLKRYMHVSNYFYQDCQIELAEKLKAITGFDKVFFSNSGAEAIEGSIKLVRRWGKQYNKKHIIAFTGGFHGRTYGALSLMDKPLYKSDMEPFLTDISILPYNNTVELEKKVDENTAGVFLEFIQGEGGIAEAETSFINKLFELKEKYGFMVVADEIQAGTGRTGKFFSYEHYGVIPDIVTVAKGIGGGLPLGAILVSQMLSNVFEKGMHGTTYGGNAIACVAGKVVLDELFDAGLMNKVIENGAYFKNKLQKIMDNNPEKILAVRGRGLMLGLLLSFDASVLVEFLLKKRVITNAASGNVLRIVPPLIITNNDIDEFIEALSSALSEIE